MDATATAEIYTLSLHDALPISLLEDKLCLIFKLAPSVCRMTFPILASLLVRLVVLLPFQLLRLSLATPSRWTPLALSVFLHCVVESKLFGGGQKAASGGIQGDVLATDNNTVGMGDAGIKSAIQGSNVPNPDEAVPSFVSGAMAKAGKGLLEGTLQAGTSAVSDKLLDLVGLGGKSAADKGKDTRDYLAAAFPELNAWERAGADASSAGMVDAGFENQKELTKMQLDNQK